MTSTIQVFMVGQLAARAPLIENLPCSRVPAVGARRWEIVATAIASPCAAAGEKRY